MKLNGKYLKTVLSFVTLSLTALTGCGERVAATSFVKDFPRAISGPWVSYHGLSSAEYQMRFDALVGQGFRPTYVSGYAEGGQPRYAAIFDKSPSQGWVSHHGLSPEAYQIAFNRYARVGYRLTQVNGYDVGGSTYFTAIWEKLAGPAWSARHGMNSSEYQQEFNRHLGMGYRLMHVSCYAAGGDARYAAIWEQRSGVEWVARHGMDAANYQNTFNTLVQQGYRLAQVSACNVGGQDLFAAIWEKTTVLPWVARHGLGGAAYQQAFDDYRLQGYRPIVIHGYGSGGPARYVAVWQNIGYSFQDLRHINTVVERVRSATGAPAISIAIAKDGRLVYAKAFGYAEKETNTPATTASRFRIASISKPITAAAIMKLVEAGRLSLDAKVFGPNGILGNDYGTLRPYRTHVLDVTVRHLLTHTAGGWSNDSNDPMFTNPEMTAAQLITWVIDNRALTSTPGTTYAYSNFGYCILGRVIEKISGLTYDAYIRNNILAQSMMASTSIAGNTKAERQSNEVVYYDSDTNAPYSMQVRRMDAHGGWISTPIDLVRFFVRIDGFPTKPDILSASSITQMTTGSTANANYGFGLALNSAGNFWHNGSLPGTSSILVRTSSGFVWSAIANSRNNNINLDAMMWNVVNGVSAWPNFDW